MSRGECIACSDCTCHTAVLSSVKGMQQLLVMTACAMFTCLVMAACAMFQCCPKTPKPKKERVESVFSECFLSRRDSAEIPDLPKRGRLFFSE